MKNNKVHNIIRTGEGETIEFKRLWKDEHLKTLCAFANTSGGKMFLGIEDNKDVVGITNLNDLLENLPNKIANNIGVTPGLSSIELTGQSIVQIEIHYSYAPVSYHGKFFIRSGSVTRELKGGELSQFLLNKFV